MHYNNNLKYKTLFKSVIQYYKHLEIVKLLEIITLQDLVNI